MEQNKKPSGVDLTDAMTVYERLITKYVSAPPGTELTHPQVSRGIEELWNAVLRATGYPPCRVHGERKSVGNCSLCGVPFCDECWDQHFVEHHGA